MRRNIRRAIIHPLSLGYPAQDFPFRGDKNLVTEFLANAERIFETAASANGAELESGDLAILIGQDGAIHMLMGSDWPLGSLQAHHGASAAYRVSRSSAQVRVEGKSRTGSCLLQSELPSAVAKRLLADKPRYFLAAA
jgi:hypothetical protein